MKTLEIAFDANCNFACSYCNASFSTQWQNDIKKNGAYQNLVSDELWKPKPYSNSFISNFAYPVISKNRNEIVTELRKNNIEVRPMISGSMGTQPFYIKSYGKLELKNASIVDTQGIYVPNHPHLKIDEIQLISSIINQVGK